MFVTGTIFLCHYVKVLEDASWICCVEAQQRLSSFQAWQQIRLCFITLRVGGWGLGGEVMVPICRRQCWVKVCNRVNKSKSNFSENTVFQTMKTSIFERIKGKKIKNKNKSAPRSVKPGSLFHQKRK